MQKSEIRKCIRSGTQYGYGKSCMVNAHKLCNESMLCEDSSRSSCASYHNTVTIAIQITKGSPQSLPTLGYPQEHGHQNIQLHRNLMVEE